MQSLFSYWLLKIKLYRHHYLSIIFITIIGLTYNFCSGFFTLDKIKKNYKGYINYFVAESIYNILYVLYKFFMIKKFIKSYEILFYQGVYELVFGIITLAITTKYFKQFDNFYSYFDGLEGKEIGRFISLVFINFIKFFTIFINIEIFGPFHIFLLDILAGIIISFFDNDFSEFDVSISIAYFVLLIICIFMILVFIEIIQLNFCGLSTMTKKSIEERARLDSLMNDDNNENEDINLKDKDKDEKVITVDDYTFELKEFQNNKSNKLIPSDYNSNEYNEGN